MRRPWLAPFVPLYAAGMAWRDLRFRDAAARQLQRPVISIVNLSTGGSGKTPLTIALAKLLAARGIEVDVLSRGYGRKSHEAARVRPDGTAEQFGDEPLLIAREAGVPVYVAPQRYDAGRLAEADSAKDSSRQQDLRAGRLAAAHILDDGFQHRQLARTIDILLLNREDWEDCLLPAGNLREPLRAAMRASAIAIPADDPELEKELRALGWQGPVWRLHRRVELPRIDGPVFAFCGLARPAQFFAGLEAAGASVVGSKSFRDHYDYTDRIVEWLLEQAKRVGAQALITTEKDAVRLGALASALPTRLPLKTARLQIEIEDEEAALDWLVRRIASAAQQAAV